MNKLVSTFKESQEYQRLLELKKYFSKHEDLDLAYKRLKQIQKQLVRAKVDNDIIKAGTLQKEYNSIKESIIDLPFVDEYFELLEIIYNDLKMVEEEIEKSFYLDFKL